jgi:hypothetical protein
MLEPRRLRRFIFFVLILSAALCGARRSSAAEAGRVLVIGGGTTFRDAVSTALNPWNLQVLPVEMPPPRGVMPRAADEARALGQRFNATGVVWVSSEDREYALWIYDAKTEQLVSRAISNAPPFDAPTAAAFALSVKTLLRASTVAPIEERIGAGAAPHPSPSAPPTSSPPPPTPEGEPHQPPPPPPDKIEAPASLEPPPFLRGEISGGARAVASNVDARFGVGASVWPGAERRIGVGAEVLFGPGLSVTGDRFSGRFSEIGVAPNVRYRISLARRVELVPRLGMTVHATQIQGVVIATTQPTDQSRVDASADLGLGLDFVATRSLRVGLDLGASAMLRYQRYLVAGSSVFELQPIQGSVGLRLSSGLF